MATIRDVARAAGVAVSTVSLAFNQRARVSDETFRKIMAAAEATGYIANPIAKSLRIGRSPFVSLIVSDIRANYSQHFLRELERRAFDQGFLVTITDLSGTTRDQGAIIRQLVSQRVAGVMVAATSETAELLPILKDAGIPAVLFDRQVPDAENDFVGLDNRLAIGILIRRLAGLGHARIGFVGGTPDLWTSEERLAGFRESMARHDLAAAPETILNGDYSRQGGYQSAMKLLCEAEPVTAIVAANSEMLFGILRASQELGVTCPDDLSICCVDGPPWRDVFRPRITHIAQPAEDMAATASDWLLERTSQDGADTPPRTKFFAPQLVPGESCARPKA